MPIQEFPNPETADENGLLAVGGDLHPESLSLAYRSGIFPWPMPGLPLLWFSPPERAILKFNQLHVPKSLERSLRKLPYEVTFDRDFDSVIEWCSKVPRREGEMTWITSEMIRAYKHFNRMGYAHSVEVWEDGKIVGGLYGVAIDGVFAGESMFRLKPNASKIAIVRLVEHLKSKGATWMDIQVLTPHMKALGAELIPRAEYQSLLTSSQSQTRKLF